MSRTILLGCNFSVWILTANAGVASTITTSERGINSDSQTLPNGSPLDGFDVKIGQVETNRPGIIGTDATANSDVAPAAVTLLDGQEVIEDDHLGDGHATRVASVMISTDTIDSNMNGDAPTGVAFAASLYSSAYISQGGIGANQDAIVTLQYISSISDMKAVNNSWGQPKEAPTAALDGNSLLALAFDWLSNKHPNVLQVVAGNEGTGGIPLPTDSYNGMTIGILSQATDGVYRQVSSLNFYGEDANGDRTSLSLLAPGEMVEVGNLLSVETVRNGTSIAAPHVTGTVALLQQFGENRIMAVGGPRWSANSRRHESYEGGPD